MHRIYQKLRVYEMVMIIMDNGLTYNRHVVTLRTYVDDHYKSTIKIMVYDYEDSETPDFAV